MRPVRRWTPAIAFLGRRRRGVWFEEAWYCSMTCIEQEARERIERRPSRSSRPAAFRRRRASARCCCISARSPPRRSTKRCALQRESGLRLGAQLRVDGRRLARRRAARAVGAVGHRLSRRRSTRRRYPSVPGTLSRDAVRALGVVPVDADAERAPPEGRLRRAAAAPRARRRCAS